jgi:hypothetical protein
MEKNDLLLRVECSLFFQQNPYTFETEEGMALRLGRMSKDLRPALAYLVGHGILDKIGEGDSAIYRYLQPLIQEEMNIL